MPVLGSSRIRGYGYAHRRIRKAWAPVVAAGHAICPRCRTPIYPGQRWDLGHTDDRTGYTGPEHTHCNRSAGATLGNRTRRRRHRARSPYTSRAW